MLGRTLYEAWIRYADSLQDALQCIAPGRFVLRGPKAGLRDDADYAVTLNDMDSVPLKAPTPLHLVAGQIIRIHEANPERRCERYRVLTVAYTYGFVLQDDRGEHELLTFHWNRDRIPFRSIPAGHLHIGRGILATPTAVRSGDFHNAHVPTGYVEFSAIVRFAIAELGVTPLTQSWASILEGAEAAFQLPRAH